MKTIIIILVCLFCVACNKDTTVDLNEVFYTHLMVSPNPFSTQAVISFRLVKTAMVSVYVSDCYGRKFLQLVDKRETNTNPQTIVLDGSNIPQGNYYVIVKADGKEAFTRIVIVR